MISVPWQQLLEDNHALLLTVYDVFNKEGGEEPTTVSTKCLWKTQTLHARKRIQKRESKA